MVIHNETTSLFLRNSPHPFLSWHTYQFLAIVSWRNDLVVVKVKETLVITLELGRNHLSLFK